MNVKLVPRLSPLELAALDETLIEPNTDGRMHLYTAAELLSFGLDALHAWCTLRARYTLVTVELIEFLRKEIAGRSALEIGAGQGDLGFHLGIRQTDLGMQAPQFNLSVMNAFGQVPTSPPWDVERLDGEEAIRKYRPEVVIGSWITQRHIGLPFGIDEVQILAHRNLAYIHIGNDRPHAEKPIFGLEHRVFYPPWLVTRGFDQSRNHIRIWEAR